MTVEICGIWSISALTGCLMQARSRSTCHGVVVSSDGSDDDEARSCFGGLFALLQVLQQQVGQQEVPQVVGPHTDLKAVGGKAWLLGCGQIDSSIANQTVHGEPSPPVCKEQGFEKLLESRKNPILPCQGIGTTCWV